MKIKYILILSLFLISSLLFSANTMKLEILDESTEKFGKEMVEELKMLFDSEKDFILVSDTKASRLILKVQTSKTDKGFSYAVILIAPGQQGLNYYIGSMVDFVKNKKVQAGVEDIFSYTVEQTKALRGVK